MENSNIYRFYVWFCRRHTSFDKFSFCDFLNFIVQNHWHLDWNSLFLLLCLSILSYSFRLRCVSHIFVPLFHASKYLCIFLLWNGFNAIIRRSSQWYIGYACSMFKWILLCLFSFIFPCPLMACSSWMAFNINKIWVNAFLWWFSFD